MATLKSGEALGPDEVVIGDKKQGKTRQMLNEVIRTNHPDKLSDEEVNKLRVQLLPDVERIVRAHANHLRHHPGGRVLSIARVLERCVRLYAAGIPDYWFEIVARGWNRSMGGYSGIDAVVDTLVWWYQTVPKEALPDPELRNDGDSP